MVFPLTEDGCVCPSRCISGREHSQMTNCRRVSDHRCTEGGGRTRIGTGRLCQYQLSGDVRSTDNDRLLVIQWHCVTAEKGASDIPEKRDNECPGRGCSFSNI